MAVYLVERDYSSSSLSRRSWRQFAPVSNSARLACGDVGICIETYRVAAGQYEAVYSGMPAYGLGRIGRLVPASGARETARGRIAPQSASQIEQPASAALTP